jgi:hypothetical protein
VADEFSKFVEQAQRVDRGESRFGSLENEIDQHAAGGKRKSKFRYHCRVFTIFRPWQECLRCGRNFRPQKNADGTWEDPQMALEGDEDFVCPHNENDEYVELVNRVTNGEARLVRRGIETLKTGVVQSLVEWGEPVAGAAKNEDNQMPPRL